MKKNTRKKKTEGEKDDKKHKKEKQKKNKKEKQEKEKASLVFIFFFQKNYISLQFLKKLFKKKLAHGSVTNSTCLSTRAVEISICLHSVN